MKKFCFLLLLSSYLPLKADVTIFPQIINFGSFVQVQVLNSTQDNLNCSGPLYLNLGSGRMESSYYMEFIFKGNLSNRFFYPMKREERVLFASHSITCRRSY